MPAPEPADPGTTREWPGASNALGSEPSAYLRQHAHNPVHWRPFGDEAFAFAAARDVPVFLSIGYAACHWCHVMAHESFEDQDTADYLNARFVAIKVDREERPDVDSIYMAATQAISGEGGWPMSVFLTPEGLAFHAGTYFPPTAQPGRPSFRQVLEAVHEAWLERRDAVEQNARMLAVGMANAQLASAVFLDRPPESLDTSLLSEAVRLLARSEDPDGGGFGGAPKFPPSAVLEFLIRHAAAPSDTSDAARDMAGRTLAAMARSALCDQLDGGFARYSVTADWSVPHFEKMLYDNAQLLRAYVHWVRLHGDWVLPAGEAASVASRVADWMLDSLGVGDPATPDGLASSLDADTVVDGVHHEGASYLWTPASLEAALGPGDGAAVARLMNVGPSGTVSELGSPLHPGRQLSGAESRLWNRVRPVLRAARSARPQPARDDKVVAGWNGLAIAALAEAGAVLDRPELVTAAESLAEYLVRVHWRPASKAGAQKPGTSKPGAGVLIRVSHDGVARGISGLLEDYAFCAEGFLALYAVTGRRRWYGLAEELISGACARFVVDGRLSDSVGESAQVFNAQGQHAGLDPFDNAAPSGAAAFSGVLLSYAAYSGSHEHRAMASNILSLLPPIAGRAPRVAGWLLATAQAAVAGPIEAAVSGPRDQKQRELHRALLASPSPGMVVAVQIGVAGEKAADDGALPEARAAEPEVPLLEARTAAADGSPQVYLCRGMVCDLPLGSVEELMRRLDTMTEAGG
ncbi:thioredoxin domain-containing protein [Arthrobacter sp. B2a2-09]|uniref:thioredoxin domain-containing protein n=1 Tax=Arthrobacter sp. B2a2-09 TaxID=2952822 RepID=UPI0022CD20BB|nr:thioredoxin domain-containing protein [Arthrobacter sp. B2a2-09]MCZ9881358.1 thioredoxin domain-containing protein [Arthrobacter sp. B2a2-09]